MYGTVTHAPGGSEETQKDFLKNTFVIECLHRSVRQPLKTDEALVFSVGIMVNY
jgi:hypothetical protein